MLCSSDSHTYEPADLWATRLPKALRPSALRWEYVEAGSLGALGTCYFTDKAGTDAKPFSSTSRPLGANGLPMVGTVEERIQALDADGIAIEVLLANLGMLMFNMPDGELAMAHATVYNDYIAETYARRPDRFIPLAAVPMNDIGWAVREVERTAKLGMRGAMLPIVVSKSYASEDYAPLWAALQDNKMTATFHASTGFDDAGAGKDRQLAQAVSRKPTVRELTARRCFSGVEYAHNAQALIATLVGAGICERYPKLMIVSAENDAAWLTSLMGSMDNVWASCIGGPKPTLVGRYDPSLPPENKPGLVTMVNKVDVFDVEDGPDEEVQANPTILAEWSGRWPYPLKASDYVRRQVRVTFMDDRMAIACRNINGIETLMWAADFPHPESTYPSSKSIVDDLFEGVSAADRHALVAGNLAKLYGFEATP